VIVQVEISTVLQFILWQDGIKPHLVHPTTLKRFLTGSGQSKKELMILEVYKRWGYSATVNDEADAVALAYFGLSSYNNAINCTANMQSITNQWMTERASPTIKKSKKSMA
jgi:crossover junction endodeoxyribonuclease RuvC